MARKFWQWKWKYSGWKNSAFVRFLLFFVLGVFFYVTLAGNIIIETYDLEAGAVSDRTIRATKEIPDEAATVKAQEQAVRQVEDVYTTLNPDSLELADTILAKLEQINGDTQFSTSEKVDIYKGFFEQMHVETLDKLLDKAGTNERLSAEVEKRLNEQKYRIPEEIYFKFPRLSLSAIQEMRGVARDIVSRLTTDKMRDTSTARGKVPELVNASSLSSANARELVQEIIRFSVLPNQFYDEAATLKAREDARNAVDPIFIRVGDIIVKENERITDEAYDKLAQMGLLKDRVSYWPELGLILLVSLFVFVIYLFTRRSRLPIKQNNAQLLMLALIFVINLLLMKIVSLGQGLDYPYIGYLAPVALGSMLIAILLDDALAFLSSVLFSIMASLIFNTQPGQLLFDYQFGFVALTVCIASVFAIQKASQRSTILRAGLLVSVFSALSLASIILLSGQSEYVMSSIIFALLSGLVTAVLVIGLLPFFEVSFGILSSLKLVELSSPNHPLLRKLLTETPGTYHHSVMVGNLSEAAAEAIGANGLLCRVGSFYHDVGKTKRPSYFIENQGNRENPHDHMEPALSASIIHAHARDGVELLKEYKLPKQLQDIAEQHHGTTLLKFFYHKAVKLAELEGADAAEVKESDYRYPGPKAQTKEAAVVGIADCVEAAVRSLRNPTIEQIDIMVDKIIKDRLEDDQFNECDLTIKELHTVGRSLKESLLGIFHSRIEYPELPKPNKEGG
ncbi:HDIG domain-containing protein [Xylanibacillus composti]|uniref:Cyclic-di-AMP phosphodiesterase PgpH n=1 Tax=Xylanibacillus composti TaxID=1572762 RepID=A0A8J4M1F4_9BACL|nr:HDIG domain-containing metalloprotein [Xylanibacillus composti]MDT9724419.1 HDIG domain-containing protein [Xylanibacillus composti]GIQ68015.1 cyclic-di-AMP phosphodiesterase PgpH [Xylanibacillus composti]